MSKLLVALIAASFATVAGAQAGATKQEKQGTVQSVTQDAAKSTTAQGEAADVAKAKAQKSDPKALPDKSAKQAATAQTTKIVFQARPSLKTSPMFESTRNPAMPAILL